MATIWVALWKYAMEYFPEDPYYFNRDRFVLSNVKHFTPEPLYYLLI